MWVVLARFVGSIMGGKMTYPDAEWYVLCARLTREEAREVVRGSDAFIRYYKFKIYFDPFRRIPL